MLTSKYSVKCIYTTRVPNQLQSAMQSTENKTTACTNSTDVEEKVLKSLGNISIGINKRNQVRLSHLN